jgi:hypothetical protein
MCLKSGDTTFDHSSGSSSLSFRPVSLRHCPLPSENLECGRVFTRYGRGDSPLTRVEKEAPRVLTESDISVHGYPGRFLRVELKAMQ